MESFSTQIPFKVTGLDELSKKVIPGEEDSGLSTLRGCTENERQKMTEQVWPTRQAKAKKTLYFEVKEKMGQLSQGQTHVHSMLHTSV